MLSPTVDKLWASLTVVQEDPSSNGIEGDPSLVKLRDIAFNFDSFISSLVELLGEISIDVNDINCELDMDKLVLPHCVYLDPASTLMDIVDEDVCPDEVSIDNVVLESVLSSVRGFIAELTCGCVVFVSATETLFDVLFSDITMLYDVIGSMLDKWIVVNGTVTGKMLEAVRTAFIGDDKFWIWETLLIASGPFAFDALVSFPELLLSDVPKRKLSTIVPKLLNKPGEGVVEEVGEYVVGVGKTCVDLFWVFNGIGAAIVTFNWVTALAIEGGAVAIVDEFFAEVLDLVFAADVVEELLSDVPYRKPPR